MSNFVSPSSSACDLIIFGATGDLAMRKLFPALYYLYCDGILDLDTRIIGIARRPLSNSEFLEQLCTELDQHVPSSGLFRGNLARFCRLIQYHSIRNSPDIYEELQSTLSNSNRLRICYFATSSTQYANCCQGLHQAGLVNSETRFVLEKPIGTDFSTANAIHQEIDRYVQEAQIFRIDHYLGKETVQNLMALRFGNVLFEPLWRSSVVEEVQISVTENLAVEGRKEFYNQTGALRDMVQSHLLQLLCLVAMEVPRSLDPIAVRDEKLKVLHALSPITNHLVNERVIRGQYEGYNHSLDQPSQTETFVAIKAEVANWRWKGVPIYLRTGKALTQRSSKIVLKFRDVPQVIFPGNQALVANRLVLLLQPDDGIELSLMAKHPGHGMMLEPVKLSLDFHKVGDSRRLGAYERLIRDVIHGDSTLFLHRQEVELAWKWIDPILEEWNSHPDTLYSYPRGSEGPEQAKHLFPTGYGWHDEWLESMAKAS